MTEQFWYFVVLVLVFLLIVDRISAIVLARKAVDNSSSQYPADTLDKMRQAQESASKTLLETAINVALKTPITLDEEGLKLVATLQGYQVIVGEDGAITLRKPSPPAAPPVVEPPGTPPAVG